MRAQSHVVGATLLLGLGVIALGALTIGVGTMLESQAASADAERMATAMDEAVTGVERTGTYSHRVTFAQGSLGTENRTLRVLENNSVVERHDIDALVFRRDGRRVAALGGAIVRGEPDGAWLVSEPSISSSEQNDVLVIGAPVLDAGHVSVSGTGGVTTTLRTNVSHAERDLGTGEFTVAIETATPEPFERYFEAQNATTERRTFPGDMDVSVLAHYPETRQGYLVVHNLALEVGNG